MSTASRDIRAVVSETRQKGDGVSADLAAQHAALQRNFDSLNALARRDRLAVERLEKELLVLKGQRETASRSSENVPPNSMAAPPSPPSTTELERKLSKLRALSERDKALIVELQRKQAAQREELERRERSAQVLEDNLVALSKSRRAEKEALGALRDELAAAHAATKASQIETAKLRDEVKTQSTVAKDMLDAEGRASELERKLCRVRESNAAAVEEAACKLRLAESRATKAERALAKLEVEARDARALVASLEAQCARAEDELKSSQSATSQDQEAARLLSRRLAEAERSAAEATAARALVVKDLELLRDRQQSDDVALKAMTRERDAATLELETLRQDAAMAAEKSSAELEACRAAAAIAAAEAESELSALRDISVGQRVEAELSAQRRSEAEGSVASLKDELAALRERLNAEISAMRVAHSDAVAGATSKIEELENQCVELTSALEEQRDLTAEAEHSREEAAALAEAGTRSLEQACAALAAESAALEEARERIQELETESEGTAAECEAKLRNALTAKDEAEVSARRSHAERERADKEASNLRTEMKALRDMQQASETALATARLDAERHRERADAAKSELHSIVTRSTGAVNAIETAHRELEGGIAKLVQVQEAMEGDLTCMRCMALFKDPVTLSRSGDHCCSRCVSAADRDSGGSGVPLRDPILDALCGKFTFMQQSLRKLSQFEFPPPPPRLSELSSLETSDF